ncbi:MAG TPA: tRNA pseudouridine(13) synthase TruD, partial [Thermoplasmata archaeon]|nr:tRNA pseudouridine(13) synthase TruD [Thermoplasmata archaeon]
LVRGDAAQGVALYLEMPGPDPKGPGEEARRRYRDTRDARAALRDFPLEFRFERILLDHLARGQSPTRALAGLSRELRMLFIHAYQSLLFNRFLSLRWHEGVRFDQPIIGDTVLRVARDGTVPSTNAVPVEADNLEEVRTLVSRGGGRVAGPLIGYATPEGAGRPGAWIDTILEEEQIRRPMFRLPELPEIASSGAYRPLLVPTPPIQVSTESPGETDARLRLRFALPKGAYATVVLREFMKAGSSGP